MPTPMEQAHAAFLLERYFGNQFPIPGKLAVPFLTTSGVDRTILRDIWNVVDPEMHGKLFRKNQWWTVLKLVALAQQQQVGDGGAVEANHLLFQLQSTLIPLPVFAEVQLPSPKMLIQHYYHMSTVRNDSSDDALSDPLSAAFDALGPVQDAPLPSLSSGAAKQDEFAQKQQQDDDDEFGSFHSPSDSNETWTVAQNMSLTGPSQDVPSLGGARALDTVLQPQHDDEIGEFPANAESETCADPMSAALSSLAQVQDAPLSKLGAPHLNDIVQRSQQQDDDDDDDEKFGDFSGAQKEPETSSSSDPLSASLDSLAPVQNAPLHSLEAQTDIPVPPLLQDDDDDDFGDLKNAREEHETGSHMLAALDSLAPKKDEPLPPLGVHAVDTLQSQDVNDDFGDFEDAPKEHETSGAANSSSSAFDSLALGHKTTPFQVLGVHADDTVNQQGDDDDDFGEFADEPKETEACSDSPDSLSAAFNSLTPVLDTPLPLLGALGDSTVQHQGDDTADFGAFADAPKERETSVVTDPLSAALDSLAPVQDAPLPPLGAHVDNTVQHPQDYVTDDFGDFAETSKEPEASATAPKKAESSGAVDPLLAALDSFGPIPDAPLPTLGADTDSVQKEHDNDDDFCDFTDAPTEVSEAEHETSRAAYPLSSAIDSLVRVKDAPFLSVGAHADCKQDDDQFGDFACMPKDHVDSVVPDPLSAALDALAPVQDAPLPALGAYTTRYLEEQGDDDDDFGDFSDAPKETSRVEHEASADPLSVALDSVGPIDDAPLPSLGVHSDVHVQQQDDYGSFGSFADAPKEASDTVQQPQGYSDDFGGFLDARKEALRANNSPSSSIDPLSAAMDALAPIQDAPLPMLGAYTGTFPQQDDDDGFGDFEDAPIETAKAGPATASDPLSSAFDALAPVQDAPLASLGAYSDAAYQQPQDDDDDFGDFEDLEKETADVEREIDDLTSSALYALAPAQDAPLPSLGVYEQPRDNDDGVEAFADESEVAVVAESEAPSYPLSSALDALAPVQDAPLPSLGVYSDTAHHQPQHDDDDDNGFGDFKDAPEDLQPADAFDVLVPMQDSQLPIMETCMDSLQQEVDDGPKETSKVELEAISDSLSSALDALATVQDAPLPSLGSYTGTSHQQPYHDDNDFGDFENAPNDATATEVRERESQPVSVDVPNNFGSLADGANTLVQPEQAAVVGSDIDDPLSSALNEFAASHDSTLHSLNCDVVSNAFKHQEQPGNDSFGDFEDATEEPAAAEVIQPAELKESSDPLSSPFDVLTPVKNAPLQPLGAFGTLSLLEDAPLPPLGMQAMSTGKGATDSDDEEDDFVDFEDAPQDAVPPEADTTNLRNEVHGSGEESSGKAAEDLNGDFGEINDAPAQVGHITDTAGIEDTAPSSDDDDNFGDYEDALESTMEEAAPQRIWNGEDNEKSNEDAKGAVHKEVNNDDVVISCQAEASVVPAVNTSQDPFAAFATATSAPLTSFNTTSSSDFGGFESASERLDHVEDQTNAVDVLATNAVPEGFREVDDEYTGDSAFPRETILNLGESASEQVNDIEDQTSKVEMLADKAGLDAVAPSESNADDSFGDFASFQEGDSTFPQETVVKIDREKPEIEDDSVDSGDFTTVEAPKASSFDSDWGDFEKVTHSDGNVKGVNDVVAQFGAFPTPAARERDEFGDFDSFQDASAIKEMTLEEMRDTIKEMQTKLRILSITGSQMDFLKSFEPHIIPKNKSSGWALSFHKDVQKEKPKADAEQLQRGRRCCQVMTLLTSSHTKSISHWKKIINGVRDELAVGSMLLEEAKSLSGEQAVLVALATLVAGLAECVRVVRSIVATLGDLVGEHVNVGPIRWSKDVVLLQSAFQVEELWTSVQRAAKGLKLVVPKLENVIEIRTKCLLSHHSDENLLCQLTLQPLASTIKGTTQSPVEWQGKVFMACTANFWSNRVSTTVPE